MEEVLMPDKREKLLIINRSFWPVYPVIGEALLRFAEQHATKHEVGVILQDHAGIRKKLAEHQRGQGVNFYPCKAWTVSGSSIARRALDAVFFMVWVFWVLLYKRPSKVYVSTDPPVLVPFIVMLYSKFFGAKYIYHLQDIHPEATNVVVKVNPWLFRFLKWMDVLSMRKANLLLTITEEMAEEIRVRSGFRGEIAIVSNPSVAFDGVVPPPKKEKGFAFCGNAGRLQRIPLLISAIEEYLEQGGELKFIFAGAGVYEKDLKNLSEKFKDNVVYHGLVSPLKAAQLNCIYEWALLPIEDEVTRYAFPSKSSSYVFSGAKIMAICSESTSVAQWVLKNKLGVVVPPSKEEIRNFFFSVENNNISGKEFSSDRDFLKKQLDFQVFLEKLGELIFDKKNNE
ncbi:hypothetical protein N7340_00225 [Comamonas aquatica]|uniref:glycosyltransferase n=1 Tax=Comamonas aquatica TaxID=225991 RepID=UPI00244D6937|nr:glycosyltransferase [Comamonas aquatica]MDH0370218.1 hypothetical protein [Comamonas aquatica]